MMEYRMLITVVGILLFCCLDHTQGLSDEIRQEIQAHKENVTKIIDYVLQGAGQYQAHNRLAYMTDTYGPRNTGSTNLDQAIEYCRTELQQQNFSNVDLEEVTANKWTRNTETARLLEPREHDMALMSLGSSVDGHITAEVEVVHTFDELHAMAAEDENIFKDKIVLYNMEWTGYPTTVIYRTTGAKMAASYGASAALIRSVTDYSIYSPHTGQQNYNESITKIPIAAITVEDAAQIDRYRKRNQVVIVELNMTCENHGTITTHNVIAELTGTQFPEEVVIIGGHIDSWDVGFGVMDDGGGVMISWQAILNLQALGLIPKRTIRTVFWTAEEIGLVGAYQYLDVHQAENDSISLIMESDYGTFKPLGVGFSGTNSAREIMTEILQLLQPINATGVDESGSSPDTGMWIDIGVPGANLWNANEKYFYYHHSDGDNMEMEDRDDLDLCVIVWTVVSYVVANLQDKIPRVELPTVATSSVDPVDPTKASRAQGLYGNPNLAVYVLLGMVILKQWFKN